MKNIRKELKRKKIRKFLHLVGANSKQWKQHKLAVKKRVARVESRQKLNSERRKKNVEI